MRHETIPIAYGRKIFRVLYCASFQGIEQFRQEALSMKTVFSDGVIVMSLGILACSLAVGLALVYAFDKMI